MVLIQDGVEDLAQIGWLTPRLRHRRWDQIPNYLPLRIRHVGLVRLPPLVSDRLFRHGAFLPMCPFLTSLWRRTAPDSLSGQPLRWADASRTSGATRAA